jgi:PP-loop superfamily ATP-utilizing enzyme
MANKLTVTQKLERISPRLRRGDINVIAFRTGYDQSHVSRVLRGERGANSYIVEAAYSQVKNRKPSFA